MNRFVNFIGAVVLCGILLKRSYVFVYLFGEPDAGSWMSQVTGVTFAFASIYFVVKIRYNWLKAVMVALDVCTILYFYLHKRMHIPVNCASVIIAAYSGLIIYFLGKTVGDRLNADQGLTVDHDVTDDRLQELENQQRTESKSTANRLQKLEDRQRIDSERRKVEAEIVLYRRQIHQSRSDETRRQHKQALQEMEEKLNQLTNKEKEFE